MLLFVTTLYVFNLNTIKYKVVMLFLFNKQIVIKKNIFTYHSV